MSFSSSSHTKWDIRTPRPRSVRADLAVETPSVVSSYSSELEGAHPNRHMQQKRTHDDENDEYSSEYDMRPLKHLYAEREIPPTFKSTPSKSVPTIQPAPELWKEQVINPELHYQDLRIKKRMLDESSTASSSPSLPDFENMSLRDDSSSAIRPAEDLDWYKHGLSSKKRTMDSLSMVSSTPSVKSFKSASFEPTATSTLAASASSVKSFESASFEPAAKSTLAASASSVSAPELQHATSDTLSSFDEAVQEKIHENRLIHLYSLLQTLKEKGPAALPKGIYQIRLHRLRELIQMAKERSGPYGRFDSDQDKIQAKMRQLELEAFTKYKGVEESEAREALKEENDIGRALVKADTEESTLRKPKSSSISFGARTKTKKTASSNRKSRSRSRSRRTRSKRTRKGSRSKSRTRSRR